MTQIKTTLYIFASNTWMNQQHLYNFGKYKLHKSNNFFTLDSFYLKTNKQPINYYNFVVNENLSGFAIW